MTQVEVVGGNCSYLPSSASSFLSYGRLAKARRPPTLTVSRPRSSLDAPAHLLAAETAQTAPLGLKRLATAPRERARRDAREPRPPRPSVPLSRLGPRRTAASPVRRVRGEQQLVDRAPSPREVDSKHLARDPLDLGHRRRGAPSVKRVQPGALRIERRPARRSPGLKPGPAGRSIGPLPKPGPSAGLMGRARPRRSSPDPASPPRRCARFAGPPLRCLGFQAGAASEPPRERHPTQVPGAREHPLAHPAVAPCNPLLSSVSPLPVARSSRHRASAAGPFHGPHAARDDLQGPRASCGHQAAPASG